MDGYGQPASPTQNSGVNSECVDLELEDRAEHQSKAETQIKVPARSAPTRAESQTRETKPPWRRWIYFAVLVLALGAVLLISGMTVYLVMKFSASHNTQPNRVISELNQTNLTTVVPNGTYQPKSSTSQPAPPKPSPSNDPPAVATTPREVPPSSQPTDLSTDSISGSTTHLRTTSLHVVNSTMEPSANSTDHPQITQNPIGESTTAISTTPLRPTETCSNTEFSCQSDDHCVQTVNVCDGIQHCDDRSDETNCYNGPVCQGRRFTFSIDLDQAVTITSPRFPATYTLYEECHWFFSGPPGTSFLIDIIRFDVPVPDAVGIYEIEGGSRRLRITMHESLGEGLKMAFETAELEILFLSSYNSHGVGFNLSVGAVQNDEYMRCKTPPYVYEVGDICNDFSDCPDDTDETECECDDDQFRCSSGVCVDGGVGALCNGSAECKDFSDEGLECNEIYCVDIRQSLCASTLPYNRTFFPNDHADSLKDAQAKFSILEQLLPSNCTAAVRHAACMMLFPECPRFEQTQTVCRRICAEQLITTCLAAIDVDWFSCDMLPDVEVIADNTCMYNDEDLLHTGSCGTRPTNPLSRIVGGVATDITSWPWIGSLRDEYSEHRCGATLITNQWAVTAAHCVGYFNHIVLGSTDLYSAPATRREVMIDKVVSHIFYDPVNLNNDLALIKLRSRVIFSNAVQPVCLNTEQNETWIFDTCYVAGWGHTSAGGAVSFDLQEAGLPLILTHICQLQSNSPHLVSSNQMCAGYIAGGIDTCQGDSGGPLVCLGADDRWKLVGVTSSGQAACGAPESPGIYTRVSRYLDFIRQTIAADRTDA